MKRQHIQKLIMMATVATTVCGGLSHAETVAKKPNIITVFIDDLGWGDFSCFGNEQAETPAIDRLAAEGIRFTQFYVNSPICSPSRVALTTGHYPQRWKIGSYLAHRNENEKRGIAQWLDPAAPTLARFLKQAGYRTGHFGKWHMGGQRDVDDAPPISDYGFDASLTNFEGMGPKLLPLTETPDGKQGRIWQDAERLTGPATWMQRSRITGGFTEAASSFIRESVEADAPFYVNLWPDDVHAPYWPPIAQWQDDRQGKFRGVLEAMDRQLAPLFDLLRSTPGLRDNTLLLVCSDNGPEPGVGSAGALRGAKTTLYEGGIRSPLIVWGPGLVSPEAAGSSDQASVFAAFDLVPSLLAVAGVVVPQGIALDGFDVSPALLGRRPAGHPGSICWRRPPDRKLWRPLGKAVLPDLAIRRDNWKLLCDYDGGNKQLFDLSNDPGETRNLAEAEPERTATLTAEVVAWHEQLPADNGPALGRQAMQAAGVGPGNVLGRQLIAADSSRKTLAAIAADGKVEWKIPCGQIHDLHLLPDGHLLYQDGWTRIIELDADRMPVWEYDAMANGNANRPVEVHAFQRLADGITMIVESGPARIIEVDRGGNITHQFSLQVDTPSVHSDTRNARKTAAGTYLVAHEKDGVVREYDKTGKLIWEYDVPLFGKPPKGGHGPAAFGNQVYSAIRLEDGNTLIGTGNGHSVLEVTPAKEIVWKIDQHDLPGITLAWVTQVRRLANGNTLLVNCHAGPENPQIIEVTPRKKVVWTFQDFEIFGNSLPVVFLPGE
jgi:uncharacterized sulfatase